MHGVQNVCTQSHGLLSSQFTGDLSCVRKIVYNFVLFRYYFAMETSSTDLIVKALTKAIVEHRLEPGTNSLSKSSPITTTCRAPWCVRPCFA